MNFPSSYINNGNLNPPIYGFSFPAWIPRFNAAASHLKYDEIKSRLIKCKWQLISAKFLSLLEPLNRLKGVFGFIFTTEVLRIARFSSLVRISLHYKLPRLLGRRLSDLSRPVKFRVTAKWQQLSALLKKDKNLQSHYLWTNSLRWSNRRFQRDIELRLGNSKLIQS